MEYLSGYSYWLIKDTKADARRKGRWKSSEDKRLRRGKKTAVLLQNQFKIGKRRSIKEKWSEQEKDCIVPEQPRSFKGVFSIFNQAEMIAFNAATSSEMWYTLL